MVFQKKKSVKYIESTKYEELIEKSEEVGKLNYFMINNPEKFTVKSNIA